MADTITLTAALTAGLAGSGHCLAMCGGLAGALGMRARASATSTTAAIRNASLYQAGRLGGYTLAGALFGSFSAAFKSFLHLPELAMGLRVLSGMLLVLIAARILFTWNALAGLERLGANFWRRLQPLARHATQRSDVTANLVLGFLWGWLPCGLVYSMLLLATLTGSATSAAAVMLAFGIGTLPSMLTGSLCASHLQSWLRQRWPRALSGALLALFGVWMAVAALQMGGGRHHHG